MKHDFAIASIHHPMLNLWGLSIIVLGLLGSLLLLTGFLLHRYLHSGKKTNVELLYTLTHDELANPVQSALSTLDNIERRAPALEGLLNRHQADSEYTLYLSDLKDLRSALLKLINTTHNLRELSLLQMQDRAYVRDKINLVSVVQRMIVDLGPAAEEKSVRLVYEGSDAAIHVLQRASTLRRILGNIIDNATKYSGSNEEPCVVVSVSTQNRYAQVVISDNGVGMSPDRLNSLGKVPQKPTAKNIGTKGSGVGLYLVYQLLEQAGGKIKIDSAQGLGTTVTVLLPLVGPPEKLTGNMAS